MMPELLELIKLTDTNWLNLFRSKTKNRKGKEVEWVFASRNKDPLTEVNKSCAVMIVPIYKSKDGKDNKLVMTKEYRYPLRDYMYGFPAGIIEDEDTLKYTIKKELKEETGLNLISIIKVSGPVYTSPGFSDECINIVLVHVSGEITDKYQDDQEDIEVFLYTLDDVMKIFNSEKKLDAKAWPILYGFILLGKISFYSV